MHLTLVSFDFMISAHALAHATSHHPPHAHLFHQHYFGYNACFHA